MDVPAWQPGTLYPPGAIVKPATVVPLVASAPDNANFEEGNDGWVMGHANQTIHEDAAFAFDGSWFLLFSGAGTQGLAVNENHVPITPGQSITATARIQQRSHKTSAAGAAVWLVWLDSGDNVLSYTQGPEVGQASFNTWKQASVTGVAPPGAAFVAVGGFMFVGGSGGSSSMLMDAFEWTYVAPTATPTEVVFRAVQADAGYSDSQEPEWPDTVGLQVVDNEVTWEAISANIVTWTANPIAVSGYTEPTWPTIAGGQVVDNTMVWEAMSRRVDDVRVPNTPIVAITASKVFAGDGDIVGFSATVNGLDWSTANDAGYIPFGLNTYGASDITALGLYRGNLVAFNAEAFQMWQVDQDPANMAILDAVPVGCPYPKSLQSLANDLIFLSAVGYRNITIAGASTNLQADGVGEPIDPLVKAKILAGEYEPTSLYWPAQGQYWGIFGTEAFVLTINGAKARSWSRYTFPEAITDWTIHEGDLYLRTSENKVWKVDSEVLYDDFVEDYDYEVSVGVDIVGIVQWPHLDMGSLGVNKALIGFDLVCDAPEGVAVSVGYDQRNLNARTADYTVDADTLPGQPVPIPVTAPSFDLRLTFAAGQAWEFQAANLYIQDRRPTS